MKTLFDSRPQPAWLACCFDAAPVWELGLDTDLALKLYAAAFRTVGLLDDLIGSYGEDRLQALLGRAAYAKVMRALAGYCRRRFLAELAKGQTP